MTVNQSSISAYNANVRSGKIPSQRQRIYDLLLIEGPMTNRMIGKVLSIELGSVSARVNAMINNNTVSQMRLRTKKYPWVAASNNIIATTATTNTKTALAGDTLINSNSVLNKNRNGSKAVRMS